MGICQSNDTHTCSEEFQSIMLPNMDLIFTDEYSQHENPLSFSQSKQNPNQDIDIQSLQNYLNQQPLTKILYQLYSKCRIERPIELEDGIYQGQWYNGKQCGFGRMFYKNKDYYEGYWLLGQRHHMGIYIKLDQQPLIGSWFADKYQGKEISTSPMKDPNFNYSHLLNQQPHQFSDSQFYGEVTTSGKQGFGYWFKKGVFKFVGYFANDKKNGYCCEVNETESYRGYYKNGIRSGIGHLKNDKLLFIGQFENNQPTTNGIQIQI